MASHNIIFEIKGDQYLLCNAYNQQTPGIDALVRENDDGTGEYIEASYNKYATPDPARPLVLRITTDYEPISKDKGFVIGTDTRTCDIVLNSPLVDGTHLAVQIKVERRALMLKNLARQGTRATFHEQRYTVVLKGIHALPDFETVSVEFAKDVGIQIRRYDNPVDWNQYVAAFAQNTKHALPGLAMIGLDTQTKAAIASKKPSVFRRGRRLGEGGFGDVYEAIDQKTRAVYAMKLYKPDATNQWLEPAVLGNLQHENVVRYVAYITRDDEPAQLIMEYVEGPNLAEFLDPYFQHVPFSMREAQHVLRQLLEAVAHAHGKNVTHRDIKPANIILMRRNPIYIKLVDFGLATRVDQFSLHSGTVLYVAPELVDGHRTCTSKVDIFSIGVVALMLFGVTFDVQSRRPAPGDPRPHLDAVREQRELLAARGPSLPVHLDLCVQLLADDPRDRLSARECLEHPYFTSYMPDDVNAAAAPPRRHPFSTDAAIFNPRRMLNTDTAIYNPIRTLNTDTAIFNPIRTDSSSALSADFYQSSQGSSHPSSSASARYERYSECLRTTHDHESESTRSHHGDYPSHNSARSRHDDRYEGRQEEYRGEEDGDGDEGAYRLHSDRHSAPASYGRASRSGSDTSRREPQQGRYWSSSSSSSARRQDPAAPTRTNFSA